MKRPSPFKLLDALSVGGIALFMTIAAVAVTLWGEADNIGEAIALSWTVAGTGWAIYIALIILRWRYISQFDLMIRYGIMVNTAGYHTSELKLDAELDRIVLMYSKYFPNIGELFERSRVWVTFKPGIFENVPGAPARVAGFVPAGGENAFVGYFERVPGATTPDGKPVYVGAPDVAIEKTAFAHELGHVIMGRAWNDWDEERHHAFMREHGLP